MKSISFIVVVVILFTSCSTTEPPIPPIETKPELTLSFDKKSCTELWVKLTTKDLTLPAELTLKQYNPNGDSLSQIFVLNTQDSLLYIDSLLPNQIYNFQLSYIWNQASGILQQVSSNKLSASTLDTTSHNFSYQTFEFGEPLTGNSSMLYDVAIINENDIWAVGEIYINDSLGQADPQPYAVAHWNGSEWKLMKVFYHDYGTTQKFAGRIKTINAFGSDSIYVCSSANFLKWNNGDWIEKAFFMVNVPFTGQVNKMWGTSESNMFFCGNSGAIYHYNGTSWSSVTSGITLPLTDIYGNTENEVYAVGINVQEVKGVVLTGNSNGFSVTINSEIISESELFNKLYGDLAAVWLDENGTVYTGGTVLYEFKNNKWNYVRSLPENYIGGNIGSNYRGAIGSISGNSSNDYIIAGDRNTLKHFNGISWQQIGLPYNPQSPIGLVVRQKGNTVVAVGSNGSKAFIILLKR
jgi:hypothetical protein